jgi:hypothetical protein
MSIDHVTPLGHLSDEVARLIPNKPDTEVVRELRLRLGIAFEPIIEIMNEAMRLGLIISWGNFMFNPQTGSYIAPSIDVARHF